MGRLYLKFKLFIYLFIFKVIFKKETDKMRSKYFKYRYWGNFVVVIVVYLWKVFIFVGKKGKIGDKKFEKVVYDGTVFQRN